MKKILSLTCLICLIAVMITGCGSSKGVSEIVSTADALVNVAKNTDELGVIVERDTYSVITNLKTEKDTLLSNFSSYDDYLKNEQLIKDYYNKVLSESEQLSFRLQAYAINYANIILSSNSSAKEKYEEAKIINEKIYEDAFKEINDEIYEDIFKDLKDAFYDGIIKDAKKSVDYDDWYDTRSDAYDLWYDTRSDLYDNWYDTRSDLYDFWYDLRSDLYDEELEDAKKTVSDFQEDVAKQKWNGLKYTLLEMPQEETPEKNTSGQKLEEGYYVVGDYIKAGKYLFTNTSEDDYCKIVVFDTEENYNNYKNANAYTNGEEQQAIEQNAYYDIYMEEENDIAYITLKKGNVLMLSTGTGTLSKVELSKLIASNEQLPMKYGFYVVGEDLEEGQYKFICTEADYGTSLTTFENRDTYSNYFKSNRFTVGEESDAKENNAKDLKYLYEDDSFSVYLKSGNILMLEQGYVTVELLKSESSEDEKDEKTSSNGKEWKAFLQDYSDWVEDYVKIMKKYSENPSDTSILSDYADMVSELAEWQSKAEDVADELEDASPSELAEYSAELLKISTKIAQIAE